MKYLTQIARPRGLLTPTAGTPGVSAWACTGTRQHLSVEEENMALKSSPGMVGRATPAANLFCLQAVKPAFFFHHNLRVFPLKSAGVPLVLSAPQPFPPWYHPSAFTCSSRRSSPQTTLPPPASFPLPRFYLLPRAKAAESLSKHASGIKWPLSALFPPTGIQKETRNNTENNSSQIAGFL